MKIAVAAAPELEKSARLVLKALLSAGIDSFGLKFNASWKDMSHANLENALKRASHVVCVTDERGSEQDWFAFMVGWTREGDRPMALYRSDSSWKPRAWLRDLPLLDGEGEAVAFFLTQRDEWLLHEKRRQARANLLELGISWHADSLAQCVRDGDTKAVEYFLDSGYLPGVRDKHGVPLLSLAARARHQGVAELLLDRGADIDARSDDRGFTALMDAAQQGDCGMLELLLARGAETDAASKDGQTALVIAVGRNDVAMAKTLLDGGADPDISDKLGLSARKYAALFHNPDMLALLA